MTASPSPEAICDLRDLRNYVHGKICDHNQLEFGAFHMTERLLTRAGRPCGILFCVHGPRSVKLTAIWEAERNTVLFYGSSGQRLDRAHLPATTTTLVRVLPEPEEETSGN